MTPAISSGRLTPTIRIAIGVLVLLLLSVAVFSTVLWAGEFFWDDFILLVDNPLIKTKTGLWDIWFSTSNPDYFPLTSTSFWLEWRLWGMHAQGYHATNVFLHAGSGVLLWRILDRLKVPAAFFVAALFVVHPVNVESVAWIAERKNTLSMFFMCMSVWLYLRSENFPGRMVYVFAVACFLLALLAKTAVVMLPFLLLLMAWARHGRIGRKDILRAAPFFLLSLLLGLLTIFFQYHRAISDIVVRDDPWWSRAAIAGRAVWFYAGKVMWPVELTFNYPRWTLPAEGVAFVPLAGLIVAAVAVWRWRRRIGRLSVAALLGYVLMLLPMLGLLNIFFMRYSLVSDHWQYHAMPLMLIAVMGTVLKLSRRLPRGAMIVAGVLIVSMLGTESFLIARVYETPESIWRDTLAHNPSAWLAEAQLGEIYLNEARSNPAKSATAIEHLSRVVQLQPQRALGYVNLGNGYVRAGQAAVAARWYTEGLSASDGTASDRARLYQGLGSLDAKAGKFAEAENYFEQARRLDPESYSINFYLAMTLFYEGKREEARAALGRALAIEPENAAALALGRELSGATTRR